MLIRSVQTHLGPKNCISIAEKLRHNNIIVLPKALHASETKNSKGKLGPTQIKKMHLDS